MNHVELLEHAPKQNDAVVVSFIRTHMVIIVYGFERQINSKEFLFLRQVLYFDLMFYIVSSLNPESFFFYAW